MSGIAPGVVSAPGVIVRAMLGRELNYLVSEELLAEYARVLRLPRIRAFHGLPDSSIDLFLRLAEEDGDMVNPTRPTNSAPDANDQHLWALLSSRPESVLVTGDRRLLESSDFPGRIMRAREFVERYLT